MELTIEEQRRVKEEERRYASDKQDRAELRAELQRSPRRCGNRACPGCLALASYW
jgi:hypothetical protein